jgi:hypothetical protein
MTFQREPAADDVWLTNFDKENDFVQKALWNGAFIAEPKATDKHDVAALERMGLKGLYISRGDHERFKRAT